MNDLAGTQSAEAILKTLAKQLAEQKLPKPTLETLSAKILESRHPVTGIDICRTGICIDIQVKKTVDQIDLPAILGPFKDGIRNVEIFPHGISLPEGSIVRITQSLDSL